MVVEGLPPCGLSEIIYYITRLLFANINYYRSFKPLKTTTMDKSNLIKKQGNNLIFYGVLLFFLGLVVGLLVPIMANPRMGVSSHLEGIMNGMFLVLLGLIWHKLDLSEKWLKITFWLAIYGTFANWFGILFAGVFNAGKLLNIAAQGQEGSPSEEAIVNFLLFSLSIAMIIISITVMIGLKRNMNKEVVTK